jgi:hypothetical protein
MQGEVSILHCSKDFSKVPDLGNMLLVGFASFEQAAG